MDPQATWNDIHQALHDKDYDLARELLESLIEWLEKGGFLPDFRD